MRSSSVASSERKAFESSCVSVARIDPESRAVQVPMGHRGGWHNLPFKETTMFTQLGRVSEETRNIVRHPPLNDGVQDWYFFMRY